MERFTGMSYAVELEEVSKIYDNGTHALRGINLRVKEGEFVGIVGPSGSGKSTLLHIAGGIDRPSEGRVKLLSMDITHMSEAQLTEFRKGKVAFVFQFYYLMEDFTVLENLTSLAEVLGLGDVKERALKVLEFLRLSHRLNHKPHQLSGGEQQRVAIGRALILEPRLLIADEPTGNLDLEEGKKIFSLFRSLNERGITFLVATHNQELIPFFSRVVKLKDGRLEGDTAGVGFEPTRDP